MDPAIAGPTSNPAVAGPAARQKTARPFLILIQALNEARGRKATVEQRENSSGEFSQGRFRVALARWSGCRELFWWISNSISV